MGISKALLLLILLSLHLPSAICIADIYALVYKGCANQSFTSGAAASQQTLAALSSSLISQSSTAKFYKTTASSSSGPRIFGLFYRRGDLRSSDCTACVGRLLPMWTSVCGTSVAVGVQLTGCYAFYHVRII